MVRKVEKDTYMKKILLSLILAFSLVFKFSNLEARNENIHAVLAGAPFYAVSIYFFYKAATHKTRKGCWFDDLFNSIEQGPFFMGGTVTGLMGCLISTLDIYNA